MKLQLQLAPYKKRYLSCTMYISSNKEHTEQLLSAGYLLITFQEQSRFRATPPPLPVPRHVPCGGRGVFVQSPDMQSQKTHERPLVAVNAFELPRRVFTNQRRHGECDSGPAGTSKLCMRHRPSAIGTCPAKVGQPFRRDTELQALANPDHTPELRGSSSVLEAQLAAVLASQKSPQEGGLGFGVLWFWGFRVVAQFPLTLVCQYGCHATQHDA